MNELVLKDFGGTIEVAPDAWELKRKAIATARQIAKVETPEQQISAVDALRLLKELRAGLEATRKAVKAPVLNLGRKIDRVANEFLDDVEKQYGRLSGLINHYQRKQGERKREEELKLEGDQNKASQLREAAAKFREQASKISVLGATDEDNARLIRTAERLEAEAFDLEMNTELAVVSGADKPKGLVVRQRINFQVLDAVVMVQAHPQFWKWNEEHEYLKLDRMRILDELNKEGGGFFHQTRFPEELSQTEDRRLVQPAGMRVYDEGPKAHLR